MASAPSARAGCYKLSNLEINAMVTVTTPGGEWGKGQGEKIRTLKELNDRTRKSSVTPLNADIITTVA